MNEGQVNLLHIIAYLMIQCNAISDMLNRQGVSDEAIEIWLDEKYPSMKVAWKSLFGGEVMA